MKFRFLAIAFAATLMMVSAQAQVSKHLGSGSKTGQGFTGSSLVYAQNPNYNGAYSSQNDIGGFGNFATVYDNFTLGSTTSIDAVEWIGSYFNGGFAGNITGFTLTFWGDSGGQPGNAIASYFTPTNAGETFLQNDNVGDPTYLYGVNLAPAFTAAAGTQYWLSIVPDLCFSCGDGQWGWETSSEGDGLAYQDFFGARSALPSDMAFALFGTSSTTPEPGTLVLLGTGLVGLAGTIRRKLL
jgi:hypothetical protein